MAEVNGSADLGAHADSANGAAIRQALARVSGLARLVLNAVKSRREYHDGKLHVDAEDLWDVLNVMAACGRDCRQRHQLDLGADWAHLWGTVALLDAEGMRWLEVYQGEPPEADMVAAEVALELVIETSVRLAALLDDAAAHVDVAGPDGAPPMATEDC